MDKDTPPQEHEYNKEYLLGVVNALETEAFELANKALAECEVNIGIIENYPVDNILPLEFIELFKAIGNRASYVTAINISLRYDKSNKFFTPTAAAIQVDNDAVIDFSQSRRNAEDGQYYMQVLDSAGIPLVARPPLSSFGVFSADTLELILKGCGLTLPHHQQPAEWSEIGHILGNSKNWHSVAEQSVILSPEHQVLIRDTVDGGMIDIEDDVEALLEPQEAWQRTLTIGIESAKQGGILPTTSLQLSFTIDNPFEVPKYDGIARVPVAHEVAEIDLFTPEMTRHEIEEKRKPVKPNTGMLDSLRNSILEARLLLELL